VQLSRAVNRSDKTRRKSISLLTEGQPNQARSIDLAASQVQSFKPLTNVSVTDEQFAREKSPLGRRTSGFSTRSVGSVETPRAANMTMVSPRGVTVEKSVHKISSQQSSPKRSGLFNGSSRQVHPLSSDSSINSINSKHKDSGSIHAYGSFMTNASNNSTNGKDAANITDFFTATVNEASNRRGKASSFYEINARKSQKDRLSPTRKMSENAQKTGLEVSKSRFGRPSDAAMAYAANAATARSSFG
jgi:hypothetical protein